MNVASDPRIVGLVRRLEAWCQEEIAAKSALEERLIAQDAALASDDAAEFENATIEVMKLVEAEPARARTRLALVESLADAWGVDARALTLGGIAVRAGAEGERLRGLRTSLREVCERTQALGRRIALVSNAQRAVLTEVLDAVLASGRPDERGRGAIVDAEG